MENEIRTCFSNTFCRTIEMALRMKFTNIQNLEVSMDETGTATIIFDQTEYTQKEVEDYITELKKITAK